MLKRIFDFFVFSSLFIAFCAVLMVYQTSLLFSIPLSFRRFRQTSSRSTRSACPTGKPNATNSRGPWKRWASAERGTGDLRRELALHRFSPRSHKRKIPDFKLIPGHLKFFQYLTNFFQCSAVLSEANVGGSFGSTAICLTIRKEPI